MNPLTNVKNIKKLSEQELKTGTKSSWHDEYKSSAWIFIGGLPYDLTEGDVICVFSQYGEVVNINLVRDKESGKSKGFCFLCYEDQRSTVLAVDNLNGIKVLKRTIRVDHVRDYKMPKTNNKMTSEARQLIEEGCATTQVAAVKREPSPEDVKDILAVKHIKKEKISKKKHKKKEKVEKKSKKRRKTRSSESSGTTSSANSD